MNLKSFFFIAIVVAFLAGAVYLAMLCFAIAALPVPVDRVPAMTSGQWVGIGTVRALLVLALAGAYAAMISFSGLGLSLWGIWDRQKGGWIALAVFVIISLFGLAGSGYFMIARPVL